MRSRVSSANASRSASAQIEHVLDEAGTPKTAHGKARVEALRADLKKDLAAIAASPDSRYVDKALRADILQSSHSLDTTRSNLSIAQAQWSKYDHIFAGPDVAAGLGANSLGPDELKALIAQESFDLTKNDLEGDVAGIAQMKREEEKRVGGKPGERKKPEKAIVLAAKLLKLYAGDLDKALAKVPPAVERKKFIMAAYNGGVNAISIAQREAIKMSRDGTTWDSLVQGDDKSPLHKAIEATYPADKVDAKYVEVVEYISKITARLPQQP